MKFSRKDFLLSLVTGFYTGFIVWRIFEFLNVQIGLFGRKLCWSEGGFLGDVAISCWGISWAWLMIVIPVLWILGVNLGYFLEKWFGFFSQFGKFSAIGFTNAAVDFGILNLLIFYSGIAAGIYFSVFKGVSFLTAAVHSYFWNKYWSFSAGESGVNSQEFFKFFSITILAALINVAAASIVVNLIGLQFGLTAAAWANVGAVIGSAAALIVSFIGFKKIVFRK